MGTRLASRSTRAAPLRSSRTSITNAFAAWSEAEPKPSHRTYTNVRGKGKNLLADSATTERALRCLTSYCMPGNCRRTPVLTILERVWYIPRETATLNLVRYEHPGGWRSALNFVTEV